MAGKPQPATRSADKLKGPPATRVGWRAAPPARRTAVAVAALAGLAVAVWAGSTLLTGHPAPTSAPTEPPAAVATESPGVDPTVGPIGPTASTGPLPTPAPGGGLVRAFAAPGDTAAGLAWDGTSLWVSGGTELFKVDPAGKVLGVFAPPAYTPEGLAWDGSRFWLFTTDASEIHRFAVDESAPDEEPPILDSIQPPSRTIGGGINHGLAWDGSGLWFSDSFSVYRLDTSGQVLTTLAFAREVSGLAWDGARLWLAQANWPDPATLAAADADGNITITILTPLMEVTSMVWADGQLVVAGSDEFAGQPAIWRLEPEGGA